MHRKTVYLVLAVVLACAPGARAADGKPAGEGLGPDFRAPNKTRGLTPAEAVREFEADGEESYQIGEGDEITVEIWGRAELSGKHVVGPDGKITLPVSGCLRITGQSREEAARAIHDALAPFYADPMVNVRIERYTSSRVFILGRVANAGALQFENPPTLLEAITRAGSLPVAGLGPDKTMLTRCAVFRGRDRVIWIDLKELLMQGNLALNLRLKRNDLIYVPDSDDRLVYVLGEVQRPGALRLTPEMSLMDAYAQAGGATADAASSRIHLIRPSRGADRELSLRGLLQSNRELNVALEDGDIIYVPPRNLARVGYWMQKISPYSSFLLVGAAMKN
ncbi:MAG TPA: polysaccharide biosynthesis/export family protein [Bryobacteraceae bacterium]|nr:polysaccharide biosynthesis/export family protein [Bryobacteraceae bacterium]